MDPKNKSKILAVITARGGSKGLPGKNIKLLGGKPLIAYTIEVAKKSKLISHLIVSTDDKGIAEVAKRFGAEVPFMRPKELATDEAGHLGVMKHAVAFMEKKEGIIFDYVVILQPTSPFKTADDIDNTIKVISAKKADSAVSMIEVGKDNHPVKIKKILNGMVVPYCVKEKEGLRRQDIPVAYKRSGDVYVINRDLLMKKNKIFGKRIAGFLVPSERSVDINNEFDWFRAEYILKKLKEKKQS